MTNEKGNLCGEISRECGWSNAMFDYQIDTATNKVTYRVDCYIHGSACSWERFFDDYAEAAREFDAACEMCNEANAEMRKARAA